VILKKMILKEIVSFFSKARGLVSERVISTHAPTAKQKVRRSVLLLILDPVYNVRNRPNNDPKIDDTEPIVPRCCQFFGLDFNQASPSPQGGNL
jgi:hypothetical protein